MKSKRIEKMMQGVRIEKYPICVEKVRLMTESYRQTQGEPEVLRRAKALAHSLDNITIFIRDGELIVGNAASTYMGVEIEFNYGPWPKTEIEALKSEGWLIGDNELKEVEQMNEYWRGRGLVTRIGRSFDDERLWPFMQTGIVYAPWKSKEEGSGGGYAESGMGLGPGFYNNIYEYEKVLNGGFAPIIADAGRELSALRFLSPGSVEKGDFLNALIISLNAVIRFARRFSALASKMAKEERDPDRKKELEEIAQICNRVPAEPARNFKEAIQSFWFCYLMMSPSPTSGLGRMDQFLYPFYKEDMSQGAITEEEVLEYLQCLRIKDMEINRISGMANRQKNAGMAKWHNCTIGGQLRDGGDAANELSYLILEAASRCPTPHHTITLRVHQGTPDALMLKAVQLVRSGIGMPAFVGDKSYIGYFVGHGVPVEEARNYGMAGCIDAALPGKSCMVAVAMFIVPMVLEITLNNGIFPKTGAQLGPKTGDPETFTSFDELMGAFKKQFTYFLEFNAEYNNLWAQAIIDGFPDPVRTALMDNPVKVGKSLANRPYLFDNLCVLNMVGMMNAADSLTAIKKLVFEDKRWSMKEVSAALKANWAGYEDMRKAFLNAPKYGNDSDYADGVAAEIYRHLADASVTFGTVLGGTQKPSGISISAQGPGGAQTGATAEGRFAGEYLADGAVSPVQGMDVNGPTAMIKSAAKIDHTPMQATLFNMKFHPSALASEEDMKKLAFLIKTYFDLGGKHVQFNVVDSGTLVAAKKEPEKHKDLIVRVAGYSAYFVKLTPPIQNEIISRTELRKA
ncbi:MAG TPA: pyruvate formate lyase family protein [Syntrophorhabdaceae bacterium]|nr:pyruvate formate lyase family protein [Syntrophorhabdaceae bacterium]